MYRYITYKFSAYKRATLTTNDDTYTIKYIAKTRNMGTTNVYICYVI